MLPHFFNRTHDKKSEFPVMKLVVVVEDYGEREIVVELLGQFISILSDGLCFWCAFL